MPPRPIVTLLTDFGTTDSYVAQMKGVLLSRCPDAVLVDITHQVPPQDVHRAAQLLAECVPQFPAGTVHLAVVDPGVGSERAALVVQAREQYFVLPDNGLISEVWQAADCPQAWVVRRNDLISGQPSSTFHGRDIFAPAAAYLARGEKVDGLGTIHQPILFDPPLQPGQVVPGCWECRVHSVDHFGNIAFCVRPSQIGLPSGRKVTVESENLGSWEVRFVGTYSQGQPGELVLLEDSQGRLELAVVGGSALQRAAVPVAGTVKIWP